MSFEKKDLLVANEGDRNLYITDDINNQTFTDIIKATRGIITEDEKIAAHNKRILKNYFNMDVDFSEKKYNKETNIYISTYGGEVYFGFAILDTIAELNKHCKVSLYAKGVVASAGVICFLSVPVKQRFCNRNTIFMIHQVSSFAFGEVKNMEESVEQTKKLNEQILDIITSNTKITKEKLQDIVDKKQDWYINAEQALELGLVSKIID